MYRIAICDDEMSAVQQFIIELDKIKKLFKVEIKSDVFNSAKRYPATIFIFMTGYNKYVYDAFAVRPCFLASKSIIENENK